MPQTLGDFIRERRQDLGLTQEALAERVDDHLRQSDISRLERDEIALPRRERLEQLAKALEVSLGELLVRSGWMVEGEEAVTAVTLIAPPDEDLHASDDPDLASLVADVATLQTSVDAMAELLTHVDQTLALLTRALNPDHNIRGIIRTPAGLMDDWETAAVTAL